MALTWDLSKIENSKELCYVAVEGETLENGEQAYRLNPVTEALIWLTMITDIGWEITEANAPEFYARIWIFERINGNILSGPAEDTAITERDVWQHIGLSTNVAEKTRAQFLKKHTGDAMDLQARGFRRAYEESKKVTA